MYIWEDLPRSSKNQNQKHTISFGRRYIVSWLFRHYMRTAAGPERCTYNNETHYIYIFALGHWNSSYTTHLISLPVCWHCAPGEELTAIVCISFDHTQKRCDIYEHINSIYIYGVQNACLFASLGRVGDSCVAEWVRINISWFFGVYLWETNISGYTHLSSLTAQNGYKWFVLSGIL